MQTFKVEQTTTLVTPSGQRYPIGKLIGSGSFGNVHECGPGKIAKVVQAKTPAVAKSLIEEVTIQKKLGDKEPGVCPIIYDFGAVPQYNSYVIIMEQCEGTARSLLQKDPTVVVDYYEQIATIMQRLEKYEFNHRDLKSDNVMYKTDSTGKKTFLLIDFGFSCATLDGKRYAGGSYFKPKDPCFRRSRDLAQLVFESLYFIKGDALKFAQLLLTFDLNGKTCDMTKGCKPLFYPVEWRETYKFLNRPGVENPNTTPEGLLNAVESFRQGGLASCQAGFVVHPVANQCVRVPGPPAPGALKLAKSPSPHVASPAVSPSPAGSTPVSSPFTISIAASSTPPPAAAKKKQKAPCPPGKELNPKTKRCVKKKCPPGKELNPKTLRCVKKKCPPGKVLNPYTGVCVKKTK